MLKVCACAFIQKHREYGLDKVNTIGEAALHSVRLDAESTPGATAV